MWRQIEEKERVKKNVMKKTYHLCLSAGEEVMFRDNEDYHRGFNCFALALYKTGSSGLVESFMSTHTHQLVQSTDPDAFIQSFRLSYSMYFNQKYRRRGKLGEPRHFALEIAGHHHLIAAASYILRNALHHGIVPIPYAYPHCSVNAIFRTEMGKFLTERLLKPASYQRHIGRRADFPESYKMSESGVFLRETVLDIPQIENIFGTPRAFNYYMSRKSSEEWEAEQNRDNNGISPINLEAIEYGVRSHSLDKMLIYESGKADYTKVSDITLCSELDRLARNRYGRHSVYQLTLKEKQEIASELYRTRHISEPQIRRCLAFPK